MPTRCNQCGYLVTGPCVVCTERAPVTRITRVAQTEAGKPLSSMVTATTRRPEAAVGKPVTWTREQCLRAGRAWMAAHPETPLYTSHCKARYGLPTHKVVHALFGNIVGFREALGLPAGRQTPRSVA